MKLTLAHFRVLLAAVILIACSAMVSSAPNFAREAWDIALKIGVAGDSTALPANDTDPLPSHTAATAQDSHHNTCGQDCGTNCMSSPGSGCCGAAVPLTSGDKASDRASIAAYGMEARFLGTGINPETFLKPPKSLA